MIRLQHIEKSFGGKKVLKNIDLEFRRGELTFLVGTSGAGKTWSPCMWSWTEAGIWITAACPRPG